MMEKLVLVVLAVAAARSSAAKHVFISAELSWTDAQEFCRSSYTDLSPLTNDLEKLVFRQSASADRSGWVGVYWTTPRCSWSGTSGIQQTLNVSLLWRNKRLVVEKKLELQGFFCLNLIVVQEEKTWEEALDHCRENHQDFTSLLSQTENLLAQNRIQNSSVTQRVWVGLRFLGDTWMWVNGNPLWYQAWTQTGDQNQQSPVWKRCGALTKQGEWENRDCEERLHFICV